MRLRFAAGALILAISGCAVSAIDGRLGLLIALCGVPVIVFGIVEANGQ